MANDFGMDPLSLPFSRNKQSAVLGHLLTNDKFFAMSKEKIQPQWFQDPWAARVYKAQLGFAKVVGRPPSAAELRECRDFLLEDPGNQTKMLAAMEHASVQQGEYGLDYLAPELTEWLKCRIFQSSIAQSVDLFNRRQFNPACELLNKTYAEIVDVDFAGGRETDFGGYEEYLNTSEVETHNALTTGLRILDEKLLPNSLSGGLLPGDATILLAPTNVGKTTAMITVIGHNLKAGKAVLFVAHEGRAADIREKLWCTVLGVNKAELMRMYKTPEGQTKMNSALALIKSNFTYIHLAKAGLTVEEVARTIRRQQEERKARTGKGYDMLVDDYPAKLVADYANHVQMQRRHMDEYIYNYFVQLAIEYNFHALLAIQTNREGSKINQYGGKHGHESRLLTMEDVLESWGPMTAATNVISLNRDEKAESGNYMTWYICKSRSNRKGYAIVCRTDYDKCTTHSNDLGATWYTGQDTHGNIDAMLQKYTNQQIPISELLNLS